MLGGGQPLYSVADARRICFFMPLRLAFVKQVFLSPCIVITTSVSPSITDIEVLIERGPSFSTETLHRSILPGLCLIFCDKYNPSMETSSMGSFKLDAPMVAKVA